MTFTACAEDLAQTPQYRLQARAAQDEGDLIMKRREDWQQESHHTAAMTIGAAVLGALLVALSLSA